MTAKFCIHCGGPWIAGAAFCTECGGAAQPEGEAGAGALAPPVQAVSGAEAARVQPPDGIPRLVDLRGSSSSAVTTTKTGTRSEAREDGEFARGWWDEAPAEASLASSSLPTGDSSRASAPAWSEPTAASSVLVEGERPGRGSAIGVLGGGLATLAAFVALPLVGDTQGWSGARIAALAGTYVDDTHLDGSWWLLWLVPICAAAVAMIGARQRWRHLEDESRRFNSGVVVLISGAVVAACLIGALILHHKANAALADYEPGVRALALVGGGYWVILFGMTTALLSASADMIRIGRRPYSHSPERFHRPMGPVRQ